MITEFKIFEKIGNFKYYYNIPYNNLELIKLSLERCKLVSTGMIESIMSDLDNNDLIGEGLTSLYIIFSQDNVCQGYYGIYTENTMVNFLEFKRKEGLKDKGFIKLEDWEVDAKKYNL